MCIVRMALKAWSVMLSDDFDMYMYETCEKVLISVFNGLCVNEVCIWYVNYENV